MATSYKTPGVYVEEISKFPPSVAQVETAIPAFIGYTEKATNKIVGDLNGIPTRVSSLIEYEAYFGKAKDETTIAVTINDTIENGKVANRTLVIDQPTSKQPFLMYYSMQLYFANGGGPCYIVSVGRFGNELKDGETASTLISKTELSAGLLTLEKYDEPTIILFPDATNLTSVDDFYAIYKDALSQCKKLQDRVTILDTYSYDAKSASDSNIATFREKVNLELEYLKYGAAYYPFLETILDYQFSEKEIVVAHFSTDSTAYDLIETNLAKIEHLTSGIPGVVDRLANITLPIIAGDISNVLFKMYDSATGFDIGGTFSSDSTKKTDFIALADTLVDTLKELVDWKDKLNTEANAAAQTIKEEDVTVKNSIESTLATFNTDFTGTDKIDEIYKNLKDLLEKYQAANTETKEKNLLNINSVNFDKELLKLLKYTPLNSQTAVVSVEINLLANIKTNLAALVAEIKKVKGKDKNNGELNGRSLSAVNEADNATYNKIINEIKSLPMILPPSSAMAGVYARVDNDRGVWKAPANVGLNYVIKPTVKITSEDQESLNIDSTAGKSINAIRAFTGKGILVWGARTLAGNDNEWRYVPVRRFYNMVEESVKKATSQFVFEPNDANTWVKVRAMIENFLSLQWRAGALAGAKQEDAYYVRVGLGQTMTAQDILNGYMNVEIGMAVVRPAEFIILKFSHKLQES